MVDLIDALPVHYGRADLVAELTGLLLADSSCAGGAILLSLWGFGLSARKRVVGFDASQAARAGCRSRPVAGFALDHVDVLDLAVRVAHELIRYIKAHSSQKAAAFFVTIRASFG
eukprot:CAMPEP_0185498968 /NCGR_PEP_ID=MMETSP1366-20130426/20036_1 /TAXON_ID=38817 /ORGANISM="Gephyrocapsa oceanica, Strain RCC1303" /LENGTH=114 /DNA_ID=CAMNT_0028108157 /DNA_START=460 /DNA_END=804 /DNA_ORIENTATION=+